MTANYVQIQTKSYLDLIRKTIDIIALDLLSYIKGLIDYVVYIVSYQYLNFQSRNYCYNKLLSDLNQPSLFKKRT
jgi:hypothetical protein